MLKSTGTYPSLIVDTTAQRAVSHAGAVLLAATASRIGLDRELSTAAVDAAVGGAQPRQGRAGPGNRGRDRRRGCRTAGTPWDRTPRDRTPRVRT